MVTRFLNCYPSYNNCTHYFCFENSFPIRARNTTHKITPALLTKELSTRKKKMWGSLPHENAEKADSKMWKIRGPPKGVGHGGGRWKLNQVFSRLFKNLEKNPVKTPRRKTCWKMRRVRRKLGIWWCRDGQGTYRSPAKGKPGKKPVQFFTDPLLTDPFWPEPKNADDRPYDDWP